MAVGCTASVLRRDIDELESVSLDVRLRAKAREIEINSVDLVPGDIVRLRSGVVPADILLLRGSALVDVSGVTGSQHCHYYLITCLRMYARAVIVRMY
jgi:P-type E1-E2 ATPase